MPKTKSGFTIVELLIVIVVIAILAAITIVAYANVQSRARDSARLNDISIIKKAISLYRVNNEGQVPICAAGNGTTCLLSTLSSTLIPDYLAKIPQDVNPAYPYYYVGYNPGGGAAPSWSVRVYMHNTPNNFCKAGENMFATWWSSAPDCHN